MQEDAATTRINSTLRDGVSPIQDRTLSRLTDLLLQETGDSDIANLHLLHEVHLGSAMDWANIRTAFHPISPNAWQPNADSLIDINTPWLVLFMQLERSGSHCKWACVHRFATNDAKKPWNFIVFDPHGRDDTLGRVRRLIETKTTLHLPEETIDEPRPRPSDPGCECEWTRFSCPRSRGYEDGLYLLLCIIVLHKSTHFRQARSSIEDLSQDVDLEAKTRLWMANIESSQSTFADIPDWLMEIISSNADGN